MSTTELKEELKSYIDKADERLLNIIRAILKAGSNVKDDTSISQYNKEIEDAEARIDAGQYVKHEQVVEEMKII